MNMVRLESRAEAQPAPGTILCREPMPQTAKPASRERRTERSTAELAFMVFAAFRAHPHINSVLTHISRAQWPDVEHALNSILDPATGSDGLSPLAQNIIDLMCAERGITGKILKPYFHAVLLRLLERDHAERLIHHIEALFLALEWKAQHPAPPAPAPSEPSQESGHAGGQPQ